VSTPPKVTVLMPVYNGARYLRAAIDSVLAQSLADFELLVVDDGSSDESVAIARAIADPRVKVMAGHGRRGLPGTLNLGLKAAAGEYIARLDQDDIARHDRFEKQAAWLDARPEVALVGSLARLIDEDGRHTGLVRRPVSAIGIRWYSFLENPLIHSSAMFRRGVATALGGYDESLAISEDFDLWLRMLDAHAVENIDETLIDYRRSSTSAMAIIEADALGPRQQQLRSIMTTLIKRRLDAEFGAGSFTGDDAALFASFTFGVKRTDGERFLDLLERVRERFEAKWQERATGESDYWRTIAGQYDAIAFRMTPPSRAASFGIYAHAWVHAPRAAARVPWLRAAALMLLGKRGRQRAARRLAA
jgi:glycosyltransferase involved in cell wall biosynthesis